MEKELRNIKTKKDGLLVKLKGKRFSGNFSSTSE